MVLSLLKPASILPAVSEEEWKRIDAIAAEHRLQPLFHAEWGGQPEARSIPSPILDGWKRAHRSAALTALVQRASLMETTAWLRRAGIVSVALKGAFLAWCSYPAAAMRPMRDVDLLVRRRDLAGAWQVLRRSGFAAPLGEPQSDGASHDKHLPPLVSPSGVAIELHGRIWETGDQVGYRMPLAREERLFERALAERGEISFPAPQDMLVHLVVHAVHSHWLDVGPLVLADIGFLLRTVEPDWPSFWAEGQREGWSRAAAIVFALTDRWRVPGLLDRCACPLGVPEDVLEEASHLVLQSLENRAGARMLARLRRSGWPELLQAKAAEFRARPLYAVANLPRRFSQLRQATAAPQDRQRTDAMMRLGHWLNDS